MSVSRSSSSDGSVLIDTLAEPTENHLDRPEIQNLGTIYYRKSATLNDRNDLFGGQRHLL
jgi:hypothetical protein